MLLWYPSPAPVCILIGPVVRTGKRLTAGAERYQRIPTVVHSACSAHIRVPNKNNEERGHVSLALILPREHLCAS
jgi:hypothetical protein